MSAARSVPMVCHAARFTALALALLATSCHLIFPFEVEPRQDRDAALVDATAADAAAADATDDATDDADAATDAQPPDQSPPPGCVKAPDSNTLALYTFDDKTKPMADAVGKHPGSVTGAPLSVPGQVGCGAALAFPAVVTELANDYGVIPNHADWDTVRSVDLWVRFDATKPLEHAGVLTRDAVNETMPGHLRIARMCNNMIHVRLQHSLGEINLCSAPLSEGSWHYVGLNLGQPAVELVVDGVPAKPGGAIYCGGIQYNCSSSGPAAADLAGNANAWIVGASNDASTEGKLDYIRRQLHGAVDSLRLSAVRRSFASH